MPVLGGTLETGAAGEFFPAGQLGGGGILFLGFLIFFCFNWKRLIS